MIKGFNSINLTNPYIYYKYRYELLITSINALEFSVERDRLYIKDDAKRVINETFKFDGYVECLFDLGVTTESETESFWNFSKQIRHDAKEILYNTI